MLEELTAKAKNPQKPTTLKYWLPVFLSCDRMGKWREEEVVKHFLNF